MTDRAVILANYTHAEFKPGLKVCRVMLEIPQEKRKQFFDAFGYPDPANPVPVAIARIDPKAASAEPLPSAPERAAEGPKPESRAQAAGRLCNRKDFQEWVGTRLWGASKTWEATADTAATYVRDHCGVTSRSDLDPDKNPDACEKWDRLRDTYEVESKWGSR